MQISEKRTRIAQKMRKENREEIKQGIREAALSRVLSVEKPLLSTCLEDYWECTHWELMQSRERLSMTIESIRPQELTDEDHDEFITDLLYLVHELGIVLPCEYRFRNNGSPLTAMLVAYCANTLDEDIEYWLHYMGEEDKQVVFLGISAEDCSHTKWLEQRSLFVFMMRKMKTSTEAALAFLELLTASSDFTKQHADQSIPYVLGAVERNLTSQNHELQMALFQIWLNLTKIYARLKTDPDKLSGLVYTLKQQIQNRIDLLLTSSTVQDLNQIYELMMHDYLEDNTCEQLLERVAHSLEDVNSVLANEDVCLYRNYLCRLCCNNWRAKQLINRNFHYSQQTYRLLQFINGQQENPYYHKLQSFPH